MTTEFYHGYNILSLILRQGQLKEVTKAALLSLMRMGMQEMSWVLEVKGEATEASASDREIPALAALRAPQSFAPSPHMMTR